MNTTWIKLYRKANDKGIMKDHKAWAVFSWLLINVDQDGKRTLGRFQACDELGINPNTYYKVVKRLEKKWEVITVTTTNKFTTVWIVNWDKYQQSNSASDKPATITRQSSGLESNTKQEYKNKEYKNNNIVLLDKPKVIKKYERLPLEKQQPLHRISYHLEDTLKNNTVNWGKAAKATEMMLKANYTEKQIMWTISEMAKEDYYQDKGFDLMDVANQIAKYKAKARKAIYVQQIN